tara:strand:- start:596 stop:928 length:333 start_codon:yes stop_codon:yes gene_type:complete
MKFAHYSENIFADHLDLFSIDWIYEPTSFPLKWGSGSIKMMFTPDFYLPQLDIYVEITTMNQNLITKKQKKIKLAKRLYPQYKFKLINESQFYNFLNSDTEFLAKKAIAS